MSGDRLVSWWGYIVNIAVIHNIAIKAGIMVYLFDDRRRNQAAAIISNNRRYFNTPRYLLLIFLLIPLCCWPH